jgi:hypothetical protein
MGRAGEPVPVNRVLRIAAEISIALDPLRYISLVKIVGVVRTVIDIHPGAFEYIISKHVSGGTVIDLDVREDVFDNVVFHQTARRREE